MKINKLFYFTPQDDEFSTRKPKCIFGMENLKVGRYLFVIEISQVRHDDSLSAFFRRKPTNPVEGTANQNPSQKLTKKQECGQRFWSMDGKKRLKYLDKIKC